MLKFLIRIFFLVTAGALIYDFSQTGDFSKSHTYRYLKSNGWLDYGQIVLEELLIFYYKAFEWAEKHLPVYYSETCTNLKPYISLSFDLMLILRNSIVALLYNYSCYFNKNYPTALDDVSIQVYTLINSALASTKEGLVTVSAHLQNYTLSAVKYANEMFGS